MVCWCFGDVLMPVASVTDLYDTVVIGLRIVSFLRYAAK